MTPRREPLKTGSTSGAGLSAGAARQLLAALRELKKGNFAVRLPAYPDATASQIAAELNAIIELNERNAKNLSQVARVIGAVAEGDLFRTMDLEVGGRPLTGQFLRTAKTVNSMVSQLRSFTSEVTRVAEEVGTEGRLGGQASVPGAAGTWKDLTDNVNQLAAALTNQLRAIAEVATAVTEGDLTRSIRVDARGEVAVLKDKINEMIRNLKETTQKNMEQDWLKTNLAKQTQMLQGHRELATVARLLLSEVPPLVGAQHGAFYILETADGIEPVLRLAATYAYPAGDAPKEFRIGEGLVGQCALDGKRILLSVVPDQYLRVRSSLGETGAANLVVLPALFEGRLKAVLELASIQPFSGPSLDFLDQLMETIGIVLNTIEVNMRTEELLKQSQRLFAEAQEASRSKSAFLSMAAHELRTPLSVVIGYLSMLQDGSLPPDRWQGALRVLVEKARELNSLVNDLLMAARIEGGTVPTEVATLDLREITRQAIGRAEARATLLKGEILFEEPPTPVLVDADREQLGRIVDNLINNSLTYTVGAPWVRISVTDGEQPQLNIEDHGIGIPVELRERIFERFFRIDDPAIGPQPGTGLGLYISRELAERHGGSLGLERGEVGKGSTFVLRLPVRAGSERQVAVLSGPVVAAALEGVSAP